MDEKFNRDVAAVEADGKSRYPDGRWEAALNAIRKNVGPAGIPEDGMRQILAQPDPTEVIYRAGKEALLMQSDSGDHEAEALYRQMREDERQAYRRLRGR